MSRASCNRCCKGNSRVLSWTSFHSSANCSTIFCVDENIFCWNYLSRKFRNLLGISAGIWYKVKCSASFRVVVSVSVKWRLRTRGKMQTENKMHTVDRFTLSLQYGFYTQSAFYPWSAVPILHLRACLHGGGGPQIGEVTCGWSPHLSWKRGQI